MKIDPFRQQSGLCICLHLHDPKLLDGKFTFLIRWLKWQMHSPYGLNPCQYIGRDMKTAYAGMGISEADAEKALVATLDKFKVPEKEKGEVIGAIQGLKKDIVEAK